MFALVMVAVIILSKHRQQQSLHPTILTFILENPSLNHPLVPWASDKSRITSNQSHLRCVILVFQPCGVFLYLRILAALFFLGGGLSPALSAMHCGGRNTQKRSKKKGRQHWLLKRTTGGSVSCILQIHSV